MYKCLKCKSVFDTPSERREDVGGYETGVGYRAYYERYATCPECGSDCIEPAVRCADCGAYEYEDSAYLSDDLEYFCAECYRNYEEKESEINEDP